MTKTAEVQIEFEVYENEPRKIGKASLARFEILSSYAERVEKFLKDAPVNLRADKGWLEKVTNTLVNYSTANGIITGSSPYMDVLLQTVLPQRDLIDGQTLLKLWRQNEEKNPFGFTHIGFGLALRDTENPNEYLAEALFSDFKGRGIDLGNGLVPDYYMLDVVPTQNTDSGLEFELNDLTPKDVASISVYPWRFEGERGLRRACLNESDWGSYDSDLSDSYSDGRVVRFNGEAVEARKPENDGLINEADLERAVSRVREYGSRFK